MTYTPRVRSRFHSRMNDMIPEWIREGELPPRARTEAHQFTDEQARQIRRRYANGDYTQQEIADHYDVGRNTIGRLVRGESYKHVGGPTIRQQQTSFTDVQRQEIIRRYQQTDISQDKLADEYGCGQATIYRILNG